MSIEKISRSPQDTDVTDSEWQLAIQIIQLVREFFQDDFHPDIRELAIIFEVDDAGGVQVRCRLIILLPGFDQLITLQPTCAIIPDRHLAKVIVNTICSTGEQGLTIFARELPEHSAALKAGAQAFGKKFKMR